MDVNWYALEKIGPEVLQARRAEAQAAEIARAARRHTTRWLVGAALIKIGQALVAGSRWPVSDERTMNAITR